ncbi:MAG: hypothetical protein GF307_11460 [candidate division Zixibacteria bacterium]|nr:hypothetical protein [candidate division Zixibacteria bacterium]
MAYRIILSAFLALSVIMALGCGKGDKEPEVQQQVTEQPEVDTTRQMAQEPVSKFNNPSFRKKGYCVQVYSFKEYPRAKEAAIKFTNRGYTTYIEDVEVIGEGIYHRVRIGSFSSVKEAQRICRELKARYGVNCWVDKD